MTKMSDLPIVSSNDRGIDYEVVVCRNSNDEPMGFCGYVAYDGDGDGMEMRRWLSAPGGITYVNANTGVSPSGNITGDIVFGFDTMHHGMLNCDENKTPFDTSVNRVEKQHQFNRVTPTTAHLWTVEVADRLADLQSGGHTDD